MRLVSFLCTGYINQFEGHLRIVEIFLLYLILKLNAVHDTLSWAIVAFIIICVLLGIGMLASHDFNNIKAYKSFKFWFFSTITVLVVAVGLKTLLPTTKEASILAGAWVVKEVVTSETVKRIASNSVAAIEEWLADMRKAPAK